MDKKQNIIEQLNKILENTGHIYQPYDFLYENLPDAYEEELDSKCIALILEHNKKVAIDLVNSHNELVELINKAANQEETFIEEQTIIEQPPIEEKIEFPDYDSYIDLLLYAKEQDTLHKQLEDLSNIQIPINSLKFSIFKRIKQIEINIKQSILHNTLNNITNYQKEIIKLKELLKSIDETKIQEITNEQETRYNIIFIPKTNQKLYLYDDITNYLDQSKEIKTAIDKMCSGYIIEAKLIKSIVGKNEKLFEYKTPSGLRIMFIISGSNIFVSLLFYKDKQKSSKIDLLYTEAIKRYQSNLDYIINNINNPDFILEQATSLGELYNLLENRSLKLTKGE